MKKLLIIAPLLTVIALVGGLLIAENRAHESLDAELREAVSEKHIFTASNKVKQPQTDVDLAIDVANLIDSLLSERDGKMGMALFGHKMREQHGVTAKKAGSKTWTAFFTGGKDERFALVGEGLEAFITLAGRAQNCVESNQDDA